MSRWSIRRSALAILPVVLLASACTSGATTGATTGPVADTGVPATATASATPGANAIAGAGAAASPDASVSSAEPPASSLAAEGGDPVVGQLGSFTWGDGGSDSPWLPGSPLVVGSGERLTVTVADGVAVEDWTAQRVLVGTTDGSHAVGLGSGGAPISFRAPDVGSWSVQVTVRFAASLGSGTYYWHLTVR